MKAAAFVLGSILLTQVCCQVSDKLLHPQVNETDSVGLLQNLMEKARKTGAGVHGFGQTVMGFFNAYYEDHIEPVTESYKTWASDITNTMWEKTRATIVNYMPFK